MKGCTDFDFSFFKSMNHMTFYSMALGNVPRAPLLAAFLFEPRHTYHFDK